MNVKDYLEQLNGLHLEVQMLTDKRNDLLELSKELNQMNHNVHERLKLAVDISELMDQVTASQNDLIQFKIEALNFIDLLEDESHRIFLRLRYAQGLSLVDVGKKLFCTRRHVSHMINKGLKELQELFDKKGMIE